MTSYINALITKVHKSSDKAKDGMFEYSVNLHNPDETNLFTNCKLFSNYRKVFTGTQVTILEKDNKKYIFDVKCSSNENHTFEFLMDMCSDWLYDNKQYNFRSFVFEVNDFSKKLKVLVDNLKLNDIIRKIIIVYENFDDLDNNYVDVFNVNYKKSYKDITNEEIIELIRYIVNEYHVNDSYDLKENYTRRDLLNSMIQKPKFDPSLFIYNIFKNNFGINKVDDISKLPKFIIKLIKDSKYRTHCKQIFDTLKLFNRIYHYNDKNSSKYDDDEEDTSDIESFSDDNNDEGYYAKLNEYLYEKADNGKLVINEYKKDNLTEDNELIIAFRDELIKYLPKIIRNSRMYYLTKDTELINQIINSLDNSNRFNAQCIILNIIYYLTGYKEYSGKLALSTIPKYHLGRLSNRWKKYFKKDVKYFENDIGKSEIYNYISKVELIKVIKGVLKNFKNTFDQCKNKDVWSVEDSIYELSDEKLNYLHNISEKKIIIILDKLVKLNRLSLFNDNIYVTEVFIALKTCSKFIYKRVNDDLINFQESQHYNEEHDYKTNQQLAAKNISLSSTSAVIGFPGTGKTDVLVSEIFNHNKDCDVWVITPTGKATSNIIGKCEKLTPNTRESKLIISTIDSRRFNLMYKPNDVTNITLYVDEAGMIGCHKFYQFIKTIEDKGIQIDKLVFFGDTNQLPPVNDICKTSILKEYQKLVNSDIFKDLKDTYDNVPNITELDEIVRSENEEMCEMFKDLSKGKTLRLKNMISGSNSKVKCVSKRHFEDSLMNNVNFNRKSEHLVLTLENNTVDEYNSKFQKNHHNLRGSNKCFRGSSEYEFKNNKYLYGDIVMNLKNRKVEYKEDHAGHPITELLPNGEIGIVIDSYNNSENERIVKVEYDCLKESKVYEHKEQLRHAYTITVHKSQGAEAEHIYFIFGSDWGASRELIYTALTRAKKTITIVTDNISKIYSVIENKPIREIKSGFQEMFESMFDIETESSSEVNDE